MFSPAYLRHVDPRFPLMWVYMEGAQMLWRGHSLYIFPITMSNPAWGNTDNACTVYEAITSLAFVTGRNRSVARCLSLFLYTSQSFLSWMLNVYRYILISWLEPCLNLNLCVCRPLLWTPVMEKTHHFMAKWHIWWERGTNHWMQLAMQEDRWIDKCSKCTTVILLFLCTLYRFMGSLEGSSMTQHSRRGSVTQSVIVIVTSHIIHLTMYVAPRARSTAISRLY